MNRTIYHRNFKKLAGHVNHYYITSYIGVSNINQETKKPSTLSTYWNPKDIELTKKQTSYYLTNSGILNMCAMVEGYINDIIEEICPFLSDVQSDVQAELSNIPSKASIKKKFDKINELLTMDVKSDEFNLVLLMFTHRNNIIHSGKTTLDNDLKNRLNSSKNSINKNYKHLEVKPLIDHVNSFKALSFKETLSLFSAAQKYVENIDKNLVGKLNKISYLERNFKNNDTAKAFLKKLSMINNDERKKAKLNRFIEIHYNISNIDFQENDGINNVLDFLK